MNNQDLEVKVEASVRGQCHRRGYAAPVDVLMDIGCLSKEKYEDWRFGRVHYLEAVCTMNLNKLSFIMKVIKKYARDNGLKPSFTYYRRWGSKGKGAVKSRPLRFSKSGREEIERLYSTHYVDKHLTEKSTETAEM